MEGGRSHVGLFAEACFIWLERLPVAQEVAHGGSFTCFIRKTYGKDARMIQDRRRFLGEASGSATHIWIDDQLKDSNA